MKSPLFKHTALFSCPARLSLGSISQANQEKLLATASLDELRSLLPDEEEIAENPDLLYTSFNAAVINLINANDHGMAAETALAVCKYFKGRYMNVEHDRYQVIGHIMNYGFSSFGENKILEASTLTGETQPFNLCLGAIVYKVVNEWIADMIEESADPKSLIYKEISASWEVGYNDYDIVLGSKRLADAEIITEESQREEFEEYLKINGGTGYSDDGTPVYALIKGSDVRPLGCAFTFSPAAPVKGVTTASIAEKSDVINVRGASDHTEEEPLTAEIESKPLLTEEDKKDLAGMVIAGVKTAITEKSEEKISQQHKNTVIRNMKLKAIEDITSEWLKEAQASQVTTFIREQLEQQSEQFAEQLKEAETEKETVASELQTLRDEKADVDKKVETLSSEVETLKETIAAKEKETAFNSRMAELTESYELSAEQLKAVANQIRDLSDDEFNGWKKQFALFASKKEEAPEKDDKAKAAAEALASAEADEDLPPNGQGGESSPFAEALEAFQANLTTKR